MRRRFVTVHDIPFSEGSIAYLVMLGSLQGGEYGGWADLSIAEIAEVLDVSESTVGNAIRKIKAKTGYDVPHLSGWKAREREKYGDF